MSDQEDWDCPLCMEELDITERNFKPCPCGYQICRFCWHHIKEELNGKCPACRRTYSDENVQFIPMTPSELNRMKAETKAKDRAKKEIESMSRKHLANVRVVQKSLVYVIGLTAKITEEMLRSSEFFGQYGRITKVVINRRHAQNSTSTHPGQSPTVGVYITYARREDAAKAIGAVDGSMYNGRMLRAAYGTTKYCTYYLRNLPCQNPNCMYLHEPGEEADTFTKEDLASGNHSFNDQHQQLEHSPKPPTLNVHPNVSSATTNGYSSPRRTEAPVAVHRSESKSSDHEGGSALPATASWAKLANKPKPAVPKTSVLSLDHFPPPLSSTTTKPKSKVITIPAKKPVKPEETKVEVKPDQKSGFKQSASPEVKPATKHDAKIEAQNGEKVNAKLKAKEDSKQSSKPDVKVNNEVKEESKQPVKSDSKTKAKPEVTVSSKDSTKTLNKSEAKESSKPETKPKTAHLDEKGKPAKADPKSKVKSDATADVKEVSKSSSKSGSKESGKDDIQTETKANNPAEKSKVQPEVGSDVKSKSKKSDNVKSTVTSQSENDNNITDLNDKAKDIVKQDSKAKSASNSEITSSAASTIKENSAFSEKSVLNDKGEPTADSKSGTRQESNKTAKTVEKDSKRLFNTSVKDKPKEQPELQSEPKTDLPSNTAIETDPPISIDTIVKETLEFEKEDTETNGKPVIKAESTDIKESEEHPPDSHIEKSSANNANPAISVHTQENVDSSVPAQAENELPNSPSTETPLIKESDVSTVTEVVQSESNQQKLASVQVENVTHPVMLDELTAMNNTILKAEKALPEASDILAVSSGVEIQSNTADEDTKPPSEMTQLPRSNKTPLIPIIHPSFTQGMNYAQASPMDIKQSLLGVITEGNQLLQQHSPSGLEGKYLQDMFSQMRPDQQIHHRTQPSVSLPPGFSDVFSGANSQRHEHFVHSQQVESFSMNPPENPASHDLLSVLRSGRIGGPSEHPTSPEPPKSTSGISKPEIFSQGLTPTQAQRNIAYEQSLARSSEQTSKPKQYSKFGFALSDEESTISTSGFSHPSGHPMSPNSLNSTNISSNYSPYSMNQFRNQGGTNIAAMQEGFRALFPNVNVSFNEKTGEPTYGLGPRMNLNDHRIPNGEDWISNSYIPSHEQHFGSFMGQGQPNPQSPMRNIPAGMAPPGYGMSGVGGHRPLAHTGSFGMDGQHSDMGAMYGQGILRDMRSPPQYSYSNNVPSWNDPRQRQNSDMNNPEYISRRQEAHHFNMSQQNQHSHRGSATASDFFSDFLKAAAEKRLNDSQVEQSRGTSLPFEDPAIMTARISEQNTSVYNTQSGQHPLRNMRTQTPNVNLLSAFQNGPQSSMNSVNFAQTSHPLPQHFAAFHQVPPPSHPNDFSPNQPIPPAAFRASQYP